MVYRVFQTVNLTDNCIENSRLADDNVSTARLTVFNET
jgi:hypothetical protein